MRIEYYYNDDCSCCKDYDKVITQICVEMPQFSLKPIDTNVIKPQIELRGVPYVRVLSGSGNELYTSLGNLKYEHLKKALEGLRDDR